jgi:hypothetical protein
MPDDFVICPICGQSFTYPELAADRALGDLGATCDDCSAIILSGSPEELDALLSHVEPPIEKLIRALSRCAHQSGG